MREPVGNPEQGGSNHVSNGPGRPEEPKVGTKPEPNALVQFLSRQLNWERTDSLTTEQAKVYAKLRDWLKEVKNSCITENSADLVVASISENGCGAEAIAPEEPKAGQGKLMIEAAGRIWELEEALRRISELPLGDHRAKEIAMISLSNTSESSGRLCPNCGSVRALRGSLLDFNGTTYYTCRDKFHEAEAIAPEPIAPEPQIEIKDCPSSHTPAAGSNNYESTRTIPGTHSEGAIAPEPKPEQEEEKFVIELAGIYGFDENFLRALPTPTLEMWKMLVRDEAKRHQSTKETMEKFRSELNELKFGVEGAVKPDRDVNIIEEMDALLKRHKETICTEIGCGCPGSQMRELVDNLRREFNRAPNQQEPDRDWSQFCDQSAAEIVTDSGWPKEWEITDQGSSSWDLARLLEKHLQAYLNRVGGKQEQVGRDPEAPSH